jgi:hypothetical protein
MSNHSPTKPKYRNWLINLFILLLVTLLMLALGEGFFRWWDGYQMSSVKLEQNTSNTPPN